MRRRQILSLHEGSWLYCCIEKHSIHVEEIMERDLR